MERLNIRMPLRSVHLLLLFDRLSMLDSAGNARDRPRVPTPADVSVDLEDGDVSMLFASDELKVAKPR